MAETGLKRPDWPRPAASAAVFRGEEVLLVERGKGAPRGLWSLPGGHVEPGETVLQAALRELMEETSVTARIEGLADVRDVMIRDGSGRLTAHYVLTIFYGRWHQGEPLAGSDSPSARFVSLADLGAYKLTDGVAEVVAKARGMLTRG